MIAAPTCWPPHTNDEDDRHDTYDTGGFATRARAEEAAEALRAAGMAGDISVKTEHHTGDAGAETGRSEGFWEWLFGSSDYDRDYYNGLDVPESDSARYRSRFESGNGILLLRVADDVDVEPVLDIVESFDPLDIDEDETSAESGTCVPRPRRFM